MESQSSQAHVDLVYHGPDVDTGSMEVRDLAPAMLALASLFEAASTEMNGDRAQVKINLKSTSTNSFHLGLEILSSIGSQGVMDILHTAAELKEVLFGGAALSGGGGGVWWLIHWLKGRKPETVERREDGVHITVNGDNNTIITSPTAYNLYEQPKVRKATEDIAHIVKSEGIDAVEMQENGRVIQRIDKDNVEDFDYDGPSEVLTDDVVRKVFTIVNLAFKENNKWRVSDGSTTYMVLIEDEEFLAKVNRNEIAFAKSGQLRCHFRTIQRQTVSGIKSEYRITLVDEYIPPNQTRF